jgi:hypothetical protein
MSGLVFGSDEYISRLAEHDEHEPSPPVARWADVLMAHMTSLCRVAPDRLNGRPVLPGDWIAFPYDAWKREPAYNRVGRLLSVWTSPSRDTVYMIETLDERAISWGNCSPVRFPMNDPLLRLVVMDYLAA